jgi:FkbM family methyltransferase
MVNRTGPWHARSDLDTDLNNDARAVGLILSAMRFARHWPHNMLRAGIGMKTGGVSRDVPAIRFRLANLTALAWLSRLYLRHTADRKIAGYPSRIVHHEYGRFPLAISLEDPVAEKWYDHDWPIVPELACLCESGLRPGARVFDVGAHQGIVALMLSRLVGESGQVIAVEAEQHNFDVALTNRELNGAGNLEILHAAGGSDDGSLYFRGGLNGSVATRGHIGLARVSAVSVDGLAERYGAPDVVFIDVEGYEEQVLHGATATIAAGMSDFFVEVHVGSGLESLGGSADAVLGQFDPASFQRLVSPAASELDEYGFCDLNDRREVVAERFFLIALPRQRGA